MAASISDFVQVPRDYQARVSPAESIDAPRALDRKGPEEREVIRTVNQLAGAVEMLVGNRV